MNKTEVLIHPVRLSILQYLCIHKKATTSEIISSLPAVSKASIYNHIRLLEQNQIIEVVQENRIRGTIEKIYSLKKVAKNNDFNAILTFLLSLLSDFQKYYEKEPDPTKDMLFAGRDYLLLTVLNISSSSKSMKNYARNIIGKTVREQNSEIFQSFPLLLMRKRRRS